MSLLLRPLSSNNTGFLGGLLLGLAGLASATSAQVLGPPRAFPGDRPLVPATATQAEVVTAPGGPGFLVVWEDNRTVLNGTTNSPGSVGAGNSTDIYAARYDTNGNLLDTTPIVVANQGHNQTDPVVAWNGSHWLVVWVTQRPDWYFATDIVGVRVAPDGTVIDPQPIIIRPEAATPSNNYGQTPSVGSDGTNWLVAWKAIDFTDNKIIVEGARVGANGTVLDPSFVTLYKFNASVFGPENPDVASVGGEYLVAWNNFGPVKARRFDGALNPLGPTFGIGGLAGDTRVAASDTGYLVLSNLEAVRLSATGAILDPTPIQIPNAAPVITQGATVRWPDAAWTGAHWAVTYAISPTGSNFDDWDVWLVRVGADGTVLDPNPINVDPSGSSDTAPAVAGNGAGDMLFAYQSSAVPNQSWGDIHSTFVTSNGMPMAVQEGSLGLGRQENLSWVRGNGVHLALYSSRRSGVTSLLAQRFDDTGVAIDPEPILVNQGSEWLSYAPSGAWNGTHYLVTWLDATGLVLARRLTADLQILGFGATSVMTLMDGPPSVSALGNDFLVVVSDEFSGDQRWIRGIRVSGATGAPIEPSPFVIAFNYSFDPVVATLGNRWLVAFTNRGCHDCRTDVVLAKFVNPDGTLAGGSFTVNGPGEGVSPSIAVAGNRALIAYEDVNVFLQDGIEGRLIASDGTLLGGEFSIADPPQRQMFPSAGFDGTQFVVAWADFRTVMGVEAMRGDIYAARVQLDGTVLDPGGGFPVETGFLPEDYPAVTTGAARTLIGYLALDGVGGVPEVQRIRVRDLGMPVTCQEDLGFGGPGTTVLSVCGDPLVGSGTADLLIDSDVPGSVALLAYGTSFFPVQLFGGTIVPLPPVGIVTLNTNANGDASILGLQAGPTAMTVYAQAAVFDPLQPAGLQISNAVKIVLVP